MKHQQARDLGIPLGNSAFPGRRDESLSISLGVSLQVTGMMSARVEVTSTTSSLAWIRGLSKAERQKVSSTEHTARV